MKQAWRDDANMNHFIVNAIAMMEEEDYLTAVLFLDAVIDAVVPDDFLFEMRANAHSQLREWDKAIADLSEATRLNPDNAIHHLSLGIYKTIELFGARPHRFQDHTETLQAIQVHYADCLARAPACPTAWINCTETHLFLRQWDLAIAAYADSRSYITDTPHQVTRSWLGCLALAFSGDPIFEEDSRLLYDQSIRFPPDFHDTRQVAILLDELADDRFDPDKLAQAQTIHDKYLHHFDANN